MATAVVNSSNSSYTVTDLVNGSTVKLTYPLAGTSSYYVQSPSGEKTLSLYYQGSTVIVMSNLVASFGYGNSIFGSTDPDTALALVQTSLGSGGNSGSATPMFKIGDIKHSYYAIDHDGWVKLAGQLKSSLSVAQQANATALGFGANLVNAADLAVVGTSGTKTTGSTGGSAQATIAQANLPAVNLVGGGHSHGVNDSGHSHGSGTLAPNYNYQNFVAAAGSGATGTSFTSNSNAGSGNYTGAITGSSNASNTGLSVASSGNLIIPLGGSGAVLPTQNPYLAANTFIYLGV
jgi:hypothetical protein